MTDVRESTAGLELPGFKGTLLRPGGSGYDEARRVFNGMIDRRRGSSPGARTPTTWSLAVNLARDRRPAALGVRRRARRHRRRRRATAAICIDLRGMKGIDVDPDGAYGPGRGRVDLGRARRRHPGARLAVTGGRVTDTGIAGLALGSGSGWLERKLGFTCDNLIEAEVVTADGRRVVRVGDREPRPLLGAARRRRQLRHRHRVPVPAPPDRPDRARRHARVPGGDGRRRAAVLARLHARRARRGRQRHVAFITAPPGRLRPRTGARAADRRHRPLLRGSGRRG